MPNWLNLFRGPRALAAAALPQGATTEGGYTTDVGGTPFWSGVVENEKTPELQWPNNIEVYDRMRREDAQVISVLRAVTLPIRRTPWRIDPAGASDEVVNFVAENLGLPIKGRDPEPLPRTRDRFSWNEHLRHALLSLPFGHSVFEQVYRIGPDGRAWIRKLGWRPPRTISRIDVAADGGLIAIEQHAGGAGGKHRMGVERLVVYCNEREGGNWLGQSLLRPAYKFWLLKDRLLRVQAQTVDRNGMGVPVYVASEIPTNMEPEEYEKRQKDEIAQGLKLARGLRSGDSAGASIPHGSDMKLLGVEGTLPDADKPIRYYDEQIARAVLAHFLNLGTETGSWALGSTFADFFTMSLQSVALEIADTASQHIVEDLVDINFGEGTPAPRIVFDEIGKALSAEAIAALVRDGVINADEDLEKFVRQAMNLPQPKAADQTAPESGEGDELTEAEKARFAAETVQKVYLGVGPVLSEREARRIVRNVGAVLDDDDDTEPTPEDS